MQPPKKPLQYVKGWKRTPFKDDNGESCTLRSKMTNALLRKCMLMAPQGLGTQEKQKGLPKDNRSACDADDEEAMSLFDDCRRQVIIKHDLKCFVLTLYSTSLHKMKDRRHYRTIF